MLAFYLLLGWGERSVLSHAKNQNISDSIF